MGESTFSNVRLAQRLIRAGTNLRELVHKFRHRTLVLVKLLMLQKRVGV